MMFRPGFSFFFSCLTEIDNDVDRVISFARQKNFHFFFVQKNSTIEEETER